MHSSNTPPVHRALVTYSSTATGEIRVKIPSLLGANSEVSISYIGRRDPWSVPDIGEQIVVTSDDANLTNVFWVQIEPSASSSSNMDGGFPDSSYVGIDEINAGGV